MAAAADRFDVLIDFTRPDASMNYIEICRQAGKKVVIGTTGYSDAQKAAIAAAADQVAMVIAPNFSVGVNLSLKLLEMTAKVMGDYTDIEVIEATIGIKSMRRPVPHCGWAKWSRPRWDAI